MLSFLVYYLYVENLRHCFLPEILVIKESCDLIGREHILIYNLKLRELNWWKRCFDLLRNSLIFSSELFFTWKCLQDYPKGPLESLSKFGRNWPCLDVASHATFFGGYLQRYWWSKHPAIWLDEVILTYNLWTRNFPDIGLAQENREL